METFWSRVNCRAVTALTLVGVHWCVCVYVHSQSSLYCIRGWLTTSVYSSLPLDAFYTSLPPLQWKCFLAGGVGGDALFMSWACFVSLQQPPHVWKSHALTLSCIKYVYLATMKSPLSSLKPCVWNVGHGNKLFWIQKWLHLDDPLLYILIDRLLYHKVAKP